MFAGLTDADFDAFSPQKWRSNVYNRERLEVKQRLLPLARALGERLSPADGSTSGGPVGGPLEVTTSVEHPALFNHKQVEAQHLFFSRGEAARRALDAIIDRARGVASLLEDPTPQRSHVYLAVSLHHDRLEVALRLHPEATVDRQNLLRKTQDPFEADRLVVLLAELPDGFRFGLTATPGGLIDAHGLDRDALGERLRAFAAVPTAVGPTAAPSLAVVRVHPRVDAIHAAGALAERLASDLQALAPFYRFCAWARDNDFVSVREALEKKQTERRQKGIVAGDAVRVVRGLLAGQQGTVQEVDARGSLRVLVGKLTAKLDAADVERR
jgi:hypothetical protein